MDECKGDRATNVPAHVWERRTSWQGFHLAFTVNTYRVLQEVASHLSHLTGNELIPVMFPKMSNPPHALYALWTVEVFLDSSDMLSPQRHSVPVNLHVK